MKLIVDISEDDYKECKFRNDLLSLGGEPEDLTFNMRMEKIIANSISLEEELEKIKSEMIEDRDSFNWNIGIIDKHIAKLKGGNE